MNTKTEWHHESYETYEDAFFHTDPLGIIDKLPAPEYMEGDYPVQFGESLTIQGLLQELREWEATQSGLLKLANLIAEVCSKPRQTPSPLNTKYFDHESQYRIASFKEERYLELYSECEGSYSGGSCFDDYDNLKEFIAKQPPELLEGHGIESELKPELILAAFIVLKAEHMFDFADASHREDEPYLTVVEGNSSDHSHDEEVIAQIGQYQLVIREAILEYLAYTDIGFLGAPEEVKKACEAYVKNGSRGGQAKGKFGDELEEWLEKEIKKPIYSTVKRNAAALAEAVCKHDAVKDFYCKRKDPEDPKERQKAFKRAQVIEKFESDDYQGPPYLSLVYKKINNIINHKDNK